MTRPIIALIALILFAGIVWLLTRFLGRRVINDLIENREIPGKYFKGDK